MSNVKYMPAYVNTHRMYVIITHVIITHVIITHVIITHVITTHVIITHAIITHLQTTISQVPTHLVETKSSFVLPHVCKCLGQLHTDTSDTTNTLPEGEI